jgi:hypothetical protein
MGSEELPGLISKVKVPAAVPSLVHSSLPVPSSAEKKSLPKAPMS